MNGAALRTPEAPGICTTCGAPALFTRSRTQVVCSRCDWFEVIAAPAGARQAIKLVSPSDIPAPAPQASRAAEPVSAGPVVKAAIAAGKGRKAKTNGAPAKAPGKAQAAKTAPAAPVAAPPAPTSPAPASRSGFTGFAKVFDTAAGPYTPVVSKTTKSKKGKWTSDLTGEMRRMGRRLRFYADTFALNPHPRGADIVKMLETASSVVDSILPHIAHYSEAHDGVWPEARPWGNGEKAEKPAKAPKAEKAAKASKPAKASAPAAVKPNPAHLAVGDKVFIKGDVPKGVAAIATRAELDALVIRTIEKGRAGVQGGKDGIRFVIEVGKLERAL